MPPSNRPQTLKQAKKAYRKSGAQVRLSESELAIIERRAVLQERADRIKEREARRKANIKRKEERNQREREARQRMGIPSPAKEGIHVGPSQLGLAAFMAVGPAGGKRKRSDGSQRGSQEDRGSQATKDEDSMRTCADVTGMQHSSISRSPWRNPLQPIAVNANLIRRLSPKDDKGGKKAVEGLSHGKKNDASKQPPCNPAQNVSVKTKAQPAPKDSSQKDDRTKEESKKTTGCQARPMGPPPPCKTLHTQSTTPISQPKAPAMPPQDRPTDTRDECWDDFFASSTQIARELSPSTTIKAKPTAPTSARMPPPPPRLQTLRPLQPLPTLQPLAPLPILPKDDAADLLNLISTQDLEFPPNPSQSPPHILTDESTETNSLLAHLSTQDLDFSIDPTQAPSIPQATTSDFDEDLTEEDLEDFVLEFEFESEGKSRTTSPVLPRTKVEPDASCKEEKKHSIHTSLATKSKVPYKPLSGSKDHKQPPTRPFPEDEADSFNNFDPFEAYLAEDLSNPIDHIINHAIENAANGEFIPEEFRDPSDYLGGHLEWPDSDSDEDSVKADANGDFERSSKGEAKVDRTEMKHAGRSENEIPVVQHPDEGTQMLAEDDGFDLSTQDLRDLGC